MNELRTILKAEAHRLERENAPQMEADRIPEPSS